MRTAPSTLTATVMLAVFLCLGNGKIFAQCTLCVSASDAACSGDFDDCGSSTTGCVSTTIFQVPCNGNYSLGAKNVNCITCNCNACVLLEKVASGSIIGSTRSYCDNDQCIGTVSVSLEAGYDYRLWVCKRPCDEENTCEDCDTDCVAKGWLVSVPGPSCP